MGQKKEMAETTFEKNKKYVIQERFAKQIKKQICQSVVANLKYQLNSAELSKKDEVEAKKSLERVIESFDYEKTKAVQETRFQTALDTENYADVLKIFNQKNIAETVGEKLGMRNDTYCSTALALINGQLHDDIMDALIPYLPTEIPR